jgi:hypothetical protein
MSCVLRANGTSFDVDEFLKTSSFDSLTVFHRGEVQSPGSSAARRIEFSGMHISVSTREFSDLTGQIQDAIDFLSKNRGELKRLRDFPGLQSMDIDFPIEDRDVVYQSDVFSHKLLSLLGDLGIGLVVSRYQHTPTRVKFPRSDWKWAKRSGDPFSRTRTLLMRSCRFPWKPSFRISPTRDIPTTPCDI